MYNEKKGTDQVNVMSKKRKRIFGDRKRSIQSDGFSFSNWYVIFVAS